MLHVLIKCSLPPEIRLREQDFKASSEGLKEAAALTAQMSSKKDLPSPGQCLDFASGPRLELRNPGRPPVSHKLLFHILGPNGCF